ncbi:MBL fold metallo-hydrolase [Arthrobacter sp. CJ23]|uniref:MBL fold metallo-hydrolase n=1 Tax=Arthrobacter sp. CJ23 TaxID=2972479 RepID=UPI00215B8773|nr:MBL fold metallo-hydrolase [Arthrobacter sp. CJ23]UVJ37911.1 MBL fold metallo-hydrolase [Arthrobacter sp. CJ23]
MSPESTAQETSVRIDRVVTSGTFSLDGGTWDVDNNVWIVGDDSECIVIDPAHDPAAIFAAVGGRTVKAILLTHGHDDHIASAGAFWDLAKAPIHLHQADWMLWRAVYPEMDPDAVITDGETFSVAGVQFKAIHTPGHSPGSVSFHLKSEGTLFSGDTLFQGGPGATGRSYSDFPTIIDSIRTRLLALPEETVVLTGHGDSTTIGAEAPQLEEWIARGH